MQGPKSTRLLVREDLPTAITSSQRGSNLDVLAFNIGFLLKRRPSLAVEVLRLYEQADEVREDDPEAPLEDAKSALDAWREFCDPAFDEHS